MIYMKNWISYFTLAATCVVTQAQTTPAVSTVEAVIDAAKTSDPISPYLYGQFVEHAGNAVYRTMWSELLDDRKFFYDVGPAPQADYREKRPGWRLFRSR